jgi:mannose-1-phosphate guanylyltransferase
MARYAVIIAGGKGERFWPRSRGYRPKQFLSLLGQNSLLQQSRERIAALFAPENILVVTGHEHLSLARQQLPDLPPENFISEPEGRNTAPCIGLAAIHLRKRDPRAVMAVFPADHLVQGRDVFLQCLEKGFELAETDSALVTIGIVPTRPETGYGYIEKEENAITGDMLVHKVRRFVEKPNLDNAMAYLQSGRFFWNSGIFIWKAGLILEKFEKHMPELSWGLSAIGMKIGSEEEENVMKSIFPSLPAVSIDYGIMEKEKDILVIRGEFGWDDLGSWAALAEWFPKDNDGTAILGEHVAIDTKDCLVYGHSALIATLGVRNLVIVQTSDVVLVCDKERSQEVKTLVQILTEQKKSKYL